MFHTKESGTLSVFKKIYEQKRKKKSNISISRTTLYTQKIKFCMHENQFAVKKEQKIFWRHQKNASHTFSIYGNCMINIFFDKNFYLVRYTKFYAKKKRKFDRKFNDTI